MSSFYGIPYGSHWLQIEHTLPGDPATPIETTMLESAGTIPGVVVLMVAGRNGPGLGRLRANAAGTAIQWRAPGSSTWGTAASVPSNDVYLLQDGADRDKWLRVQVWTEHLRGGSENVVALRDVYNNAVAHLDVTAGEAAAGDVSDYTLILHNTGDGTIANLIAWIDAGTDDLELSADGSTWVSAPAESNPLHLADIPAGDSILLYVRRTIAAGAASDPAVLSLVHFRFEV